MYCIRPDPLRASVRVWLRETIGLRGPGVMPTVDIAHYEYHYLSSGVFAENRAIATLSSVISSLPLLLLYLLLVAKVAG